MVTHGLVSHGFDRLAAEQHCPVTDDVDQFRQKVTELTAHNSR